MELLASPLLGHDEARLFELVQMLHHAEARHPEPPFERAQRLPVLLEERVEQAPSSWISQRPEHLVHAKTICDLMVTCQVDAMLDGELPGQEVHDPSVGIFRVGALG